MSETERTPSRAIPRAEGLGAFATRCPFDELGIGDVVYQVMPLGLLRIERGHYEVFQPPLTEDQVRELAPGIEYGVPSGGGAEFVLNEFRERRTPAVLGPFVRIGDRVYFALQGGFRETTGSIGGLAAFELGDRTWRVHRPRSLVEVYVTEMLVLEGKLWLGTAHQSEGGTVGLSGLVRFDPESDDFRSYVPESSPIAGELVWMVRQYSADYLRLEEAALRRSLWLGTDLGLNRFTPESNAWESWVWEKLPDSNNGLPFELRHVSGSSPSVRDPAVLAR
jgi:hypothetical protein